MGLRYTDALFLMRAKKNGVCFRKVITLGHLKLNLSMSQIKKIARDYNINCDLTKYKGMKYSVEFFTDFLDAKEVGSIDYSEYQGCDIIHDLNYPIDKKYFEKYDVVIDGGTLEHIFNFPVALRTCIDLLRANGNLFIFTMANNHMGHGFYQFSPELFYSAFNESSGIAVQEMIIDKHRFPGSELSSKSKCYSVTSPFDVKSRVGLVSCSPVIMMVHAKKNKNVLNNSFPVQSDYLARYSIPNSNQTKQSISKKLLLLLIPRFFQRFIIGVMQLFQYSTLNKKVYKRIYL